MIILIPAWLVYIGTIIGFAWLAGILLLVWKAVQYLAECADEGVQAVKDALKEDGTIDTGEE